VTVLDETLVAPGPQPRAATSGKASWRFSMRLARREIRRRVGRTLLVMVLIGVPICGMTVLTVLVRTNTDSPAQAYSHDFGASDLATGGGLVDFGTANRKQAPVDSTGTTIVAPPTVAPPAGSRVISGHLSTGPFGLQTTAGKARLAQVTDLDFNDPMTKGIVELRSGRFPQRAGEALVSPKLAHAFGLKVGDTLHLATPKWTEKIVGVGVRTTDWNAGFMAVRGDELTVLSSAAGATGTTSISRVTLVDLPGNPTDAQLATYGSGYASRLSFKANNSAGQTTMWILVGGIVALAIIGIVISGAFAVGARRQLVTLGQLSANGADEQVLRRTLSLQGMLCGVLGSVAGFALGVVILLSTHGQFATLLHQSLPPYVWSGRDTTAILVVGVLTATIAAFIPARSAARVPVLSALAGRRPLGTLPKRLVPIGLTLFAAGIFVLVLVATASGIRQSNALALSAVLGGLLVLAGACCASSVVVASLATVASRVRGSARIAIRSVVRNRARSAAVVMALAAVFAGAIAIGTAAYSHSRANEVGAPFMPDDTLIVSSAGDLSGNVRQFLPPPASAVQLLKTILPQAQWSVRRAVVGHAPEIDRAPGVKRRPGTSIGPDNISPPIVTVADPAVLAFLDLSAHDRAALESNGVITVLRFGGDGSSAPAPTQITVDLGEGVTIPAVVARDHVGAIGDGGGVFITEAKARELHLPIVDAGMIARNPKPFDEEQQASLDVLAATLSVPSASSPSLFLAWNGPGGQSLSTTQIMQIILGVVLAIALIVLAMSLALSAAETRDERDILVSLGARPTTMRRVSAWKAALLAFAGAIVAVPTGFVPVAVVVLAITNSSETAHIVFPWLTTLELVLVAPLIAGGVAYLGSAVAQRVRPTRMSTFATD
jgi:putative ABC transport system permease protein